MEVTLETLDRNGVIIKTRQQTVSVGKKFIIYRDSRNCQTQYSRENGYELNRGYLGGGLQVRINAEQLAKINAENPVKEAVERELKDFNVTIKVRAKTLAGAKSFIRRETNFEIVE